MKCKFLTTFQLRLFVCITSLRGKLFLCKQRLSALWTRTPRHFNLKTKHLCSPFPSVCRRIDDWFSAVLIDFFSSPLTGNQLACIPQLTLTAFWMIMLPLLNMQPESGCRKKMSLSFSQDKLWYCSGKCSHFSKGNFLTIASAIPIPGKRLTSFEDSSATLD